MLIILAPLACAYYNTFFVAKKSFNQAERSVAESKTEIIPAEARRWYQQTIDQCHKMLVRHENSRWIDDAIYFMAASHYGIGEYDSALFRLEELDRRFPETEYRPDALFLGGLTQSKRHEYGAADSLFELVVTEYPDYRRRDEILYTLAEAAASRREKDHATELFADLIRSYPSSRLVDSSLEQVGQLHFEEGRYDSAAVFFDQLLSTTHDEEVERNAAVLQAQTLIRLDRADDALELLKIYEPEETQTERQATRVPQAQKGLTEDLARLQLQQAAALNHLKRHGEAIEVLDGISERYRASSYAVEAQFQIGYTYETLLDSIDAAQSAYEKVSGLPGRSIFKQQALQRANALRSIAELQEEAGSGDAALEARADAALRIAEILYLERDMKSDAVLKYREVKNDYPETKAASRAAYALAYIRWKADRDSLRAHEMFRKLVADFPASTQARDAIKLLVSHEADTVGLASLLVAPAIDSSLFAQPVQDSLGISSIALGDSLGMVTADSLSPAGRLRRSVRADTLSKTITRADSLRRAMVADTVGKTLMRADSLRRAMGADTLPVPPANPDSLRRARREPQPVDSIVPEESLIEGRVPAPPDTSDAEDDPDASHLPEKP